MLLDFNTFLAFPIVASTFWQCENGTSSFIGNSMKEFGSRMISLFIVVTCYTLCNKVVKKEMKKKFKLKSMMLSTQSCDLFKSGWPF